MIPKFWMFYGEPARLSGSGQMLFGLRPCPHSPRNTIQNTGRGPCFWWRARSTEKSNNSDHQAYQHGQTNDKEKAHSADHAVRFAG